MKFFRLLLLIPLPIFAATESIEGHILFLMRAGQTEQAVQVYQEQVKGNGHEATLLRKMAYAVLESSFGAQTPEEQLLALFGAGACAQAQMLPLLRNTLSSDHPEVQVASVNLLASLEHDEADALLLKAMSAPYPITRLEACLQLARKHHPSAVSHLESLMFKLPPQAHVLFPQLFALVGTPEADRALLRMLADPEPLMGVATVLSMMQADRDDFLPQIRSMAKRTHPLLQEVCAAALGHLKDSSAAPQLTRLASSSTETVRIAASQALHRLGDGKGLEKLESDARQGNLYAITALGEVEGSEELLVELLHSRDFAIRLNAAFSLLLLQDARALKALPDLLITDERDLGFTVQRSPGGALPAVKAIPSMHAHLTTDPSLEGLSLSLRELALQQVFALSEESRLVVARALFRARQYDLVPILVRLLENAQTPAALDLLKVQAEEAGAPLIRNYCNLALFRAGEKGPYKERVREWVAREQGRVLIELKPPLPWEERLKSASSYTLAPEESSRLLMESFEALAIKQDIDAVDAILDAIAHGNAQNRYALCGLLIRVME